MPGLFDLFTPDTEASDSSGSLLSSMFFPDQAARKTASGEKVSPTIALQVAAFYSAVRIIAEDLGTIPIALYDQKPGGPKTRNFKHPALGMINYAPNAEMGAVAFRESMIANALCWGGGYAEIERDGRGNPIALWPIHASRVTLMREPEMGALFYRVSGQFQTGGDKKWEAVDLDPADMFHVHGVGSDGLNGWSIIRCAAESIGISLAAQTLAGAYFGNGHQIAGVLKYPNALDEKGKQSLREQWRKMHQGASKGGGMAVLDRGGEFTRVGIPPNEAQFLESREFQIVEIARWFRISPSRLGAAGIAQGWSSLEGEGAVHVRDCLRPWAVRIEQEIDRKLLDGIGTLYARHDFGELSRGDSAGRSTYYRTMISTGAMTPNEARHSEGLNPGPEALDQYFMQGAMMPVDKLGQEPPANAPAMKKDNGRPPAQDAEDPAEEAADSAEARAQALRPVFVASADRILRREAMAVQRHAGKPGFAEWARGFYANSLQIAQSEFSGPAEAMMANSGKAPCTRDAVEQWLSACLSHVIATNGASCLPTNTPERLADLVIRACLESMK